MHIFHSPTYLRRIELNFNFTLKAQQPFTLNYFIFNKSKFAIRPLPPISLSEFGGLDSGQRSNDRGNIFALSQAIYVYLYIYVYDFFRLNLNTEHP